MKKYLSLVGGGLLALGVYGQQPSKPSNVSQDIVMTRNTRLEAEHYLKAAEGYISAANRRWAIVEESHVKSEGIIENIKKGTETNYPSAWLSVARLKRSAGTLERQIAHNFLLAGNSLEGAYCAFEILGEKRPELITQKKNLRYDRLFRDSCVSLNVARHYFEEAGAHLEAADVLESLAESDRETAETYKKLRR